MRTPLTLLAACALSAPAAAQCFNRGMTCDGSAFEVRSQLNITVPVGDKATPSELMKAVEDARRQLASVSDREFDAIKSVYGTDAALRAASFNSNMQDGGPRGRSASVSMSITYEVKRQN